jgi:hypothetical protein
MNGKTILGDPARPRRVARQESLADRSEKSLCGESMAAESSEWGAYIDAVLRMSTLGGVIWVRPAPVSRSSGECPDPESRTTCVITAHNPGGQLASGPENAAAQARLAAELRWRGLTWWPAAGGDPSSAHVEASAAVIAMEQAEAIAFGAQFGQEAIFVLNPLDARWWDCTERRIVTTGWSTKLLEA